MGRRQSCLLLCNPLRWTAIYYLFKQLTEELMLFQKVPKTHDSGVVRVSDVQRQPSKKAHRRDFINASPWQGRSCCTNVHAVNAKHG